MKRAGLLLALLAACDSPAGVAPSGTDCPPCECKCDCATATPIAADETEDGAPAPDGQGAPTPMSPDLAELVASASRKMMHGDGKGCLGDLDTLAAADPRMDARMAVIRGQCEMLAGECQRGKRRIADWYVAETALTPERAEVMAESLGSMRCRGGDASERDRLLAALFDLTDGAYVNKRDSAWCAEQVKIARDLLPRVPVRDVDDTQISGGAQALFHTAAACHARAGDCRAAFRIYRELFPGAGLSAIPDPAQREKVIRDAFDASIERCKGKG